MFSANTAGRSVPKPLAFGAGGKEEEGSQPWLPDAKGNCSGNK